MKKLIVQEYFQLMQENAMLKAKLDQSKTTLDNLQQKIEAKEQKRYDIMNLLRKL